MPEQTIPFEPITGQGEIPFEPIQPEAQARPGLLELARTPSPPWLRQFEEPVREFLNRPALPSAADIQAGARAVGIPDQPAVGAGEAAASYDELRNFLTPANALLGAAAIAQPELAPAIIAAGTAPAVGQLPGRIKRVFTGEASGPEAAATGTLLSALVAPLAGERLAPKVESRLTPLTQAEWEARYGAEAKPTEAIPFEPIAAVPPKEEPPVSPEPPAAAAPDVIPPAAQPEQAAAPVTYDEAQARVDDIETKLANTGVDVTKLVPVGERGAQTLLDSGEWQAMPPELEQAYKQRDAIGAGELKQSVTEITSALRDIGLSDAESAGVLNNYGIDAKRTDALAQGMASDAAKLAQQDPTAQAEKVAYTLAADRGEHFDELKDISPKTLRDAAKAVQTIRSYFGLASATAEGAQTLVEPPPTVTQLGDYPTLEVPISRISLSKDVPQFKEGANKETGVVPEDQLAGKYTRLGTGAVTLWQRTNGDLELISGRHRLDLAKRSGEKTIPSQIVKEANGFTKEDAITFDAEANIRDGQGKVSDYANYFRNSEISPEEASSRGLLARDKGRKGYTIGTNASDDLYALYRAGKIAEGKAATIASAAPDQPELQGVGIRAANEGASAAEITGRVEAAANAARIERPADQGDFFADTSMGETWKEQGKYVAEQRKALQDIAATRRAIVNKYEAATATGTIKAKRAQAEAELADARVQLDRWQNWASDPELRAQVERLGKPAPEPPPSPAEAPPSAPAPATAEGELFAPSETPFNLTGEAIEPPKPPEETTAFGQERLAQQEMFGIRDVVREVDPEKSANAAQQTYGDPARAARTLERQLRVIDSDPKTRKLFDKQQRARLKEVIALLDERAQQEPAKAAVLGFGGGGQPRAMPGSTKTQRPQQLAPANTGPQVQQAQTRALVGNPIAPRGIVGSLMSAIAPGARSAQHLRAAETLGSKLGEMWRQGGITDSKLARYAKQFDKLGVEREDLAPANNPGTQFASAMSTGKPVASKFAAAKAAIETEFQRRIVALRNAGIPLQKLRESYFPGMWTKESREAFNLALQQAFDQGIIPKDADLNQATAQQRAWVKDRVDQYMKAGTGSEADMLPYLSRRPLAGPETFRKPKVFDDVLDAQEFGLRPVFYNPIRIAELKLAEMDRAIMAENHFNELKAKGRLQLITPFEKAPPGWSVVNDPYGTIYGPPTISLKEWVDRGVYEGMSKVADALGIQHERFPGIGGKRLGYSVQGGQKVVTRTATETSVLAHEIGHQLDHKYGLWDTLGVPTKYGAGKTPVEMELRAIADLTERGRYARQKAEKMAQVLEAYIHAPEKMREVAPTVYARFDDFVKSTPELAPLAEIKPGLALKELQAEKYVGLPIFARRIIPDADADILNNYLSTSLYNSRYLGPLYKGWMGTANFLNQSQLGWGSAFHAGFTSADVQISAVANLLKDMYGLVRGNRSFGDLLGTAGRVTTAMARTPIQGDRILNAWRDPEPSINPRIAKVVRAVELAGGRFDMERGMFTNQIEKVRSDWHSGRKLQAVARSPVAASEMMAAPIMRYLVPRQKAGVFADLASRIIEQNPEKTLEELRPQFRQAWNRVDARLGQVVYDRLFLHNVAKNLVQGTVRAPGWTGGTIAELGGAFPDMYRYMREWVQTGRPPQELPDRVAYTASLFLSTMIVNGALTYAFTGQRPSGLDYFAFRDGGKDEYGNETRFLLPTYMKDILSYAQQPLRTLFNKAHPIIAMLRELSQNKDFYGTEIRHPDDPLYKQAGQIGRYVIKQYEPFWTRGARRTTQETGAVTSRALFPLVGVMPAPRALTETPAEQLAGEIVRSERPVGGKTQEQADKADARRQATRDLQQGRISVGQLMSDRGLSLDDAMKVAQASKETALQRLVYGMGAEDALRVWMKASPEERDQIGRQVRGKIMSSRVLSYDRQREMLKLLREE